MQTIQSFEILFILKYNYSWKALYSQIKYLSEESISVIEVLCSESACIQSFNCKIDKVYIKSIYVIYCYLIARWKKLKTWPFKKFLPKDTTCISLGQFSSIKVLVYLSLPLFFLPFVSVFQFFYPSYCCLHLIINIATELQTIQSFKIIFF